MNSSFGRSRVDIVNPINTIAMSDPAGNVDLMQLGEQFRDLRTQLDEIQASMAALDQVDLLLEEREDVMRAKLYELAWQIADTRAVSIAGLKLKAWIIAERCSEDHSDIIAALAQSLSRDISNLPG